jgi:hypothetical protein
LGHTPLLIPQDVKNLQLKKPGYKEMSINIGDYNINESIKLTPLGFESDDSFFETPLFLYMSGSLLVFGAITAYYKLEADEKYAEYQVTGDDALLQETQRLDTISGIAFAAVQINFGLLVYFFLTD